MGNIQTTLKFTLLTATALFLGSCAESWKEKTNNEWEEKYVWGVSDIAKGVLNESYSAISGYPDSYGSNFLDAATDNATTTSYGTSTDNLANGSLSAMNNPLSCWQACYNHIQYVHQFIENGLGDNVRYDKVSEEQDLAYKRQYYGEDIFFRAYWYFYLLQHYGGRDDNGKALGVPLVLRFIDTDEASQWNSLGRASYGETVNQIMSDLNCAMEYLPLEYTGSDIVTGSGSIGKPSALAAAALKTRVALYAASPAFLDDNIVSINGMGDFTVVDEQAYLNGWEYAALVADTLIRNVAFGSGFTALKAEDLADAPNTTPAEFIWRKYHNSKAMETRHFPPYYFGKANTVPSQNLVDAYPMANGYPVDDPRSGYNPDDPYKGRDARFYLTIYHHGAAFGNGDSFINVMAGGRDAYTFNSNASTTGYYLAKGLSKNSAMLNPIASSNSQHYRPIIRRTEVFLNFAEAANEAWGPSGNPKGCKYTALDVMKMIRSQSGKISDDKYVEECAAAGKDAFRKLIQNERRLEIAFENHRYFDLRRNVLDLCESIRGVKVFIEEGKLKYDTSVVVSERKYDGVKYYYLPLPYDEVFKNTSLVNNLGWK
ncbi:MAG: RagB/SusD family nutrient uptake outer membrane protein [Bacteroidales bacterium]|nr:RagB/SusD family nutrient uptake outer membrane protein [Bacteroidales bacterium]